MTDPIEFDDYRSPGYLSHHAKIDQYQVYSLAIDDHRLVDDWQTGEPGVLVYNYQLFPVRAEVIPYGNGEGDYVRTWVYDGNIDSFRVAGFQVWGKPSGNGPYYDYLIYYDLGGDQIAPIPPPYQPQSGEVLILAGGVEVFAGPEDQAFFVTLPIIVDVIEEPFPVGEAPGNARPTRNTGQNLSVLQSADCVSFQSFSPLERVPLDFGALVKRWPTQRPRLTVYSRRYYGSPSRIERFYGPERSGYRDLIFGHRLDGRKLPKFLAGIAGSDRLITWGYYRPNPEERHPNVWATLDWHRGSLKVKAGQAYRLPIYQPVIGTLILDPATFGEVVTLPGEYPKNLLVVDALGSSLIDDLLTYWDTLYPIPDPDPNYQDFGDLFSASLELYPGTTSLDDGNGSTREYLAGRTIQTSEPIPRILAANNDRWQHGTLTINHAPPAPDHPLFGVNAFNLFYSPQPDGSTGTYVMDSPRLLEIHAALEAQTYAIDPADGSPRLANLGHLIERIAALMGYRPKPDGAIDIEAETSTWARRSITGSLPNADSNSYLAGRFGSKGMLLRRLPNNGDKAGGIVAIHDVVQLQTEILDQLNQALNLQESTTIKIRDGSNSYSYPNQLALLIEIATSAIQQRRQVREIWGSSIVTQNSVNEVIAGLGLPTVAKTIAINGQSLPYWGIQPDKSLQREVATVAHNVGIATGQLL